MNQPPPLLVLTGPTASGKSALALEWALRRGGEIVSADSMQLYCGLSIGTAKPTPEERKQVPHHLIDILQIEERADVFSFVEKADAAIRDIRLRGRLPIIAGGTGFYLRALLFQLDDLPADGELRRELDERYDNVAGEAELHRVMADLDPAALEKFAGHRRKLIRALEVRRLSGRSILELQSHDPKPRYAAELFCLDRDRDELKRRIAERTRRMLDAGWIEEARDLIARGLLQTPTAHQALGYRLIGDFLAGRMNRAELEERIATTTWQFARRQLTYFRHQFPGMVFLRPGPDGSFQARE